MQYWEWRARKFGRRAVLDLGLPGIEIESFTSQQKQFLFPLLSERLTGTERVVLDFGCGPGRFTPLLADLTGGRSIGVDPIRRLLNLAPNHPRVEYRTLRRGQIPLPEESVDLVWICLVLGGIPTPDLPVTAEEIRRVMKAGGLLFLIENTDDTVGSPHWTPRPVQDYQALFSFLELEHLADNHDLGQRLSVMAGRKSHR